MMIGFYLLSAAGLFAIFQVVARRLDKAVQPLRLEFAAEGERLLHNPDLSPKVKDHVRFLMSTAFGMRSVLVASFFLVPVLAVFALFRPASLRHLGLVELCDDTGTAIQFRNLCRMHHHITVANHPILRPLLAVEMNLLLIPVVLLRAALDGVFSPPPGVDAMVITVGEHGSEAKRRLLSQARSAFA